MNSFELNKIIGAMLGTLLFVMGVGFLAEAIYHPIEDRGPGYALPEPEGTETAEGPAAPTIEPIAVRLAAASAERGASAARKCQSCHNFGEGEGHKSGPVLWDTIGHPIAGHQGYSYSNALAEIGGTGETWTFEHMDEWLSGPQTFAPGTKMSLSVSNPEERADIIAYLQTLSNSPVPLPTPEAAPAEEAPAEGAPAEAPAEGAPAEEAPAAAGDEPAAAPAEAPQTEEASDPATETPDETVVEGTPTGSQPAGGAEEAAPGETQPAQPAAPAAQ
jgi:cytochrome c